MNVETAKLAITAIAISTTLGCASMSNRQKTLTAMAVAVGVGGVVGYFTSPEGTRPLGHAALFAGISSAATGAVSLYVFDEQKRSSQLEQEVAQFKKELASCPKRTLLGEYDVHSGKPIPDHLKPFVKPEKVREYSIDIWIDKNEGEENQSQYHCDKEIEYEPGMFRRTRPSSQSISVEQKGVKKEE